MEVVGMYGKFFFFFFSNFVREYIIYIYIYR